MMKCCAVKTWVFLTAFAIGATGWAVFQSQADIKACPFEDVESPAADESKVTEVNEKLLESLRKWNEKEFERFIRIRKVSAKQAAEIRKQIHDPNQEATGRETIAQIDAQCRRERLSPFQCLTKKEVAIFDIEKNVLPRYNSLSSETSFNEWRKKRKTQKQTAEILFSDDAGAGGM